MSDRSLTPRELHLKAISVADQLERLVVAARGGAGTRGREVEVVTAAAAELRDRVFETATGPESGDEEALGHLGAARAEVVRALELVTELTRLRPLAGPIGPAGAGAAASEG